MSRMPFPAFLLAAVGALLCGGAGSAGASATDDLTAATGAGQPSYLVVTDATANQSVRGRAFAAGESCGIVCPRC